MPWRWIAGNLRMTDECMFIGACWPVPGRVRAVVSTRLGGYSSGPWASFNLGLHVGDDAGVVACNRELLCRSLGFPASPQWLSQVHGRTVVDARADGVLREGDAAYTDCPDTVCAILTADCLPVVIADCEGTETAVAHCGWRGLAAGVLEATLARFRSPASQLQAWLGPAISQAAFEVGAEVRAAFLQRAGGRSARDTAAAAFLSASDGKYHADLYALARQILETHGVYRISGGGRCTFAEEESFFSYRRDGLTGRMATLAWIDPEPGILELGF